MLCEQRVAGQAIAKPRPGWAQQDPQRWWSDLVTVTKSLDPGIRKHISTLAVDGTSSTLVLSDSQGQALAPGLMYNDVRAVAQADTIRSVAPAETAAHGAGSSLAKLLWLLEEKQSIPPAHALHQADWINGRLTGKWGYSDYNNALKLGFDPLRQCWPEWLERLDIESGLLPKVLAPGDRIGKVTPAAALETGLPEATRVLAGTTDSIAAFIATGTDKPGDAVTSLGSTLVIKIIAGQAVFAPEYGVYSHKFGDAWLVGGASNSGGAVLSRYFTDEEIADYSARIDPSRSSGLDYYPLPSAGERFPIADAKLAPRMEPVPNNDPVRFLHGLLEGIARIEQLGYARLEQLGAPRPKRIYTAGGGAANPQWLAIREQLLGRPISVPQHTEAAYGAARLATFSVGAVNGIISG